MNQNSSTYFRRRLIKLQKELKGEISQLSASILMGAQPIGEHDGCVSESLDKELTLERAEEDICQAVDDALARLAEGRFGHCVECGRNIAVQRLEALPYTAFCINCEHRREQGTRAEKETRPVAVNLVAQRFLRKPACKVRRDRRHYAVRRMESLLA